jgi:hypothetical protein
MIYYDSFQETPRNEYQVKGFVTLFVTTKKLFYKVLKMLDQLRYISKGIVEMDSFFLTFKA